MKVSVVGAGFAGLSCALYLSRKNHQITVFEKEKVLGGLASGFKEDAWQWEIERHYHHWFTNDNFALDLINDLGLEKDILIPSPLTSVFYKNQKYPFNSPLDVLSFPHLGIPDRLRVGAVLAYLKLLPADLATGLEKYTAYNWLEKYFGRRVFRILWQPLLDGKFGRYSKSINMAWFWARIKKRTPRLAYLKGGYHRLLTAMSDQIKKSGGQILLNTPYDKKYLPKSDKTVFTGPSFVFTKVFPGLPPSYTKRLLSIPHLHALNLLLITEDKFLPAEYWLNINEKGFPFIGVVAHTNFIDNKYYAGKNLTWIANYLAPGHELLNKSAGELLSVYLPYLRKINPGFNFKQLTSKNIRLFMGPFAQPVFTENYSKIRPEFNTPLKDVYLANMDMVYPWDRGTNYAIELGFKVAKHIESI